MNGLVRRCIITAVIQLTVVEKVKYIFHTENRKEVSGANYENRPPTAHKGGRAVLSFALNRRHLCPETREAFDVSSNWGGYRLCGPVNWGVMFGTGFGPKIIKPPR